MFSAVDFSDDINSLPKVSLEAFRCKSALSPVTAKNTGAYHSIESFSRTKKAFSQNRNREQRASVIENAHTINFHVSE